VLPPVRDRVRTTLLNLVFYEDIPTEQRRQMGPTATGREPSIANHALPKSFSEVFLSIK